MIDCYYVYAYLRQSDNSPYYIGKGKDSRAWSKNHGHVMVPRDESKIVMLYENLTEGDAHRIERELIKKYGRKDLGTGALLNLTDGGEGSSGRTLSETTIEKFRLITKERTKNGFGFNNDTASDAGKKGWKSKSVAKRAAALNNLKKASTKGTKWMFDPISEKFHRVKLEATDERINQGWIFKHRPAWNKGHKTK